MSRFAGVFAVLPAVLLLWYLPTLAELYRWRELTRHGASGAPGDWTAPTLVALALAMAVLAACLAVAARRPWFGVAAGLPLTAAGWYGVLSAENARTLSGHLKWLFFGGPDVASGQLRAATTAYLGQGLCLLVGAALLAAALWAQHPPRPRRHPAAAAGAGLLAMLAAWACLFEGGTREGVPRLVLTAVAAFVLGWTAGARHLPPVAPLLCGLPPLVLGLGEVLGEDILAGLVDTVLPLSADSGDHLLALRGSVLASTVPMALLGGALAAAAVGGLAFRERAGGGGRAAARKPAPPPRRRPRRAGGRPPARPRART